MQAANQKMKITIFLLMKLMNLTPLFSTPESKAKSRTPARTSAECSTSLVGSSTGSPSPKRCEQRRSCNFET